ncbi:hypothetical protein R6Q59_023087 [Mikania micrantha]
MKRSSLLIEVRTEADRVGRSSQGAEVLRRSQSRRAGGRREGAEGRGLRTEQRGEGSGVGRSTVGRESGETLMALFGYFRFSRIRKKENKK